MSDINSKNKKTVFETIEPYLLTAILLFDNHFMNKNKDKINTEKLIKEIKAMFEKGKDEKE